MNVKELIALLKEEAPETDVVVIDAEDVEYSIQKVEYNATTDTVDVFID